MPREINDTFAYNVAYNALLRIVGQTLAGAVMDAHPSVRWEREVNGHGVPVRRYVLRGQWETDPEAVRSGSQTCPECDGWASDQFALGVHRQLMHPEAVDRDRRS